MTTDLEAIGRDLQNALERRIRSKRRRSRRLRLAALSLALTGAFATVAYASGIGPDFQLDPSKWSILGGGSVDDGKGAYVHAKNRADGSNSTFLVEHDSGLPAYQAFLLHEKTLKAANSTSPVPVRSETGDLCTPGASPDATRVAVNAAVGAAFEDAPCRGLEYAGEQARLVYSGVQPESTLMPSARR